MTRKLALLRTAALASVACSILTACQNDVATRSSAYATAAQERAAGKPGFADTNSLLALADSVAASGDHAAAIPLYQRAHEARPRAPEPLLGLGRSLAATGQQMHAREAFERAVGRDKSNPIALAAYGNSLLQTDRIQDGLAFLDNALALDGALPEALRGKASALDLLGRHDEALTVYGSALATNPQDVRTLNNYGLSLALHDATDAGIATLEQALRLPDAARVGAALRQNLALAYLLRGRAEDARRMLAIDNGHAGADRRLQDLYMLSAQSPASRLASLIQGGGSVVAALPATPDGLNAQQVAALRVIGSEQIAVAALPVAETRPAPKTPIAETLPPLKPALVATAPKTPEVVKTPEVKKISAVAKTATGSWTVQIAAYRKAAQLVDGWSSFTARHGDLLSGLQPQKSEVDFGAGKKGPKGVYYRLNAGSLPTRAAATALCSSLEARGAACFVRALPATPLQLASAS